MKAKPVTRPIVKRDAEATRIAILNAAEVEFARAGLLGARTENIAEATGVTRAMIHYYYDSKEKLYREVLERAFGERVRNLQKLKINEGPADLALEEFLREFMKEQMRNVNLPTILLFEAVQNDGRFYKEIALASIYEPLSNILKRGLQEGTFRDLDPLHCSINIVGTTVFYLCARNNVKHLFPPGTDILCAQMQEQHREEALKLVLKGVLRS